MVLWLVVLSFYRLKRECSFLQIFEDYEQLKIYEEKASALIQL